MQVAGTCDCTEYDICDSCGCCMHPPWCETVCDNMQCGCHEAYVARQIADILKDEKAPGSILSRVPDYLRKHHNISLTIR